MKKIIFLLLMLAGVAINMYSQNKFFQNKEGDIQYSIIGKGSGGRALSHSQGNILTLNAGDDFVGGVNVGNYIRFRNNGDYRLDVNGAIRAARLNVEVATWSDFVFDKNYVLPSLPEVEKHINQHNHLPGIPSASQVKEKGIDVGEMQAKLLQKVEELTLYIIEQDKKIKALENQLAE